MPQVDQSHFREGCCFHFSDYGMELITSHPGGLCASCNSCEALVYISRGPGKAFLMHYPNIDGVFLQ